jgi:hypothetical protein
VTPAKNLLAETRPFAGFSPQCTSWDEPAAHEVPARDVSLTIRRNGPCVTDPLNMTSGTSFDYPHAAAWLGSTQGDNSEFCGIAIYHSLFAVRYLPVKRGQHGRKRA